MRDFVDIKMPPHSLEAEQSVLGAIMLDNACLPGVQSILTPDDFYSEAHRIILQAAVALSDAGKPVDVVTLSEALLALDKLDYVGGLQYLGAMLQNVPTAANVAHYAAIVAERAVLRRVAEHAYRVAESARAPGATIKTVRELVAGLTAATEEGAAGSPDTVVGGMLTMARAMPPFDYVARPFAVRGQMVTLTARPNHGKSTVSLALAVHHAVSRDMGPFHPRGAGLVYYVSAEDQASTALRALAYTASLRLSPDDQIELDRRLRWVRIDRNPSIADAVTKTRADANGQPIDMVFVDTGPAMFEGDDENSNTQMQTFADSCREFTRLAGEPWVAIMWHPVKSASGPESLHPRGGGSLAGTIDGNLTLWMDDDVATMGFTKVRLPHFQPIRFAIKPFPLLLDSGDHIDAPVAEIVTDEAAERIGDEASQRRERVLLAMSEGAVSTRKIALATVGSEKKKSTIQRDLDHMAGAKPALVEIDPISGDFRLTKAGEKLIPDLKNKATAAYRSASHAG